MGEYSARSFETLEMKVLFRAGNHEEEAREVQMKQEIEELTQQNSYLVDVNTSLC